LARRTAGKPLADSYDASRRIPQAEDNVHKQFLRSGVACAFGYVDSSAANQLGLAATSE
jgi:hypothetical protein